MPNQVFADPVPGSTIPDSEIVRQLVEAEKGYGTQGYERNWLSAFGAHYVLRSGANGLTFHNATSSVTLAWASSSGFGIYHPTTGNLLIQGSATGPVASVDDGTTAPTPIIVNGSAAGGDLAGTYPNPTLSAARSRQLLQPGEGTVWYGALGGIPTGRLLCNGAVVSRTTYADLFAAIGTAYNTGGEAGTDFRLPNLQGRFIVGVGSNGTIAFGYAASGGVVAGTIDASHAHPMPHTHTMAHTHNHSHTMTHDHPHSHTVNSHDHGAGSYRAEQTGETGIYVDAGDIEDVDATGGTTFFTTFSHYHDFVVDAGVVGTSGSASPGTNSDTSASSAANTGSDATASSAANTGGVSTPDTSGASPSLAALSVLPPYGSAYHVIAY